MTNKSQKKLWLNEEQLAAIVSPKTREVFMTCQSLGTASVSDIQELLDSPSKTIYYQINKLVQVGLMTEVGTEMGTRRERRVFKPIDGELGVPDGYQGARYEKLAAKGATATLRSMIRRFNAAARLAEAKPELVDSLFILSGAFRLEPDDLPQLKNEMRNLVAKYRSKDDASGLHISLAFVMTPHESRLDIERQV